MLRITAGKNAGQAKSYFKEELTKGDYYTQEIVGNWGGKGAELLGLNGQVDKEIFEKLVDNINPTLPTKDDEPAESLTVRNVNNRRPGYDFTFSVPKTVSTIYALTQDERILKAFRESVRETMQEIEEEMTTRVRKEGKNQNRVTGNMIWSEFVHFTSRPIDGVPDPHLHAHVYAINATYDSKEECWKAGQFGNAKRDATYYEAAFEARLAKCLDSMGYGIERTVLERGKKRVSGWEINLGEHTETLRGKFSRRTEEIEKKAKESEIWNDDLKATLGGRTRQKKDKSLSTSDLRKIWQGMLDASENDAIKNVCNEDETTTKNITEAEASNYAIEHSFERSSVISEKRLMAQALKHGVGSVTVESIKNSAQQNGVLLRNKVYEQEYVTTRVVLNEESEMIDFVRSGINKFKPLGNSNYDFKRDFLNLEQKSAVNHVLTSQDRVIGVRGGAGTGKTTIMQETIAAIEEQGKKVFTFAPSAEASRDVLRKEGFENADTVANLLLNNAIQNSVENNVIWIDEAGILSSKDMKRVFDIAKDHNARVILSGDAAQHSSVGRGQALKILEQYSDLKSANIREIQRQKGTYKQAIASIEKGNLEEGFETLDKMEVIKEVKTEDRYKHLAEEYLEISNEKYEKGKNRGKYKTALVVSPTHAEGEKTTQVIRSKLRESKRIGQEDRSFVRLKDLSFTEAEKKNALKYKAGYVLHFHRNCKGIKRGEKFTVTSIEGDNVFLSNSSGRKSQLHFDQVKHCSVYGADTIALAKGDKIRITKNGSTWNKKHRLNNGATYEIKGFTKGGKIILNNDWKVSEDYGHIAHGYSVTSHSSQGKTVDKVIIAQSSQSFPASSREQFYVSSSRGREGITIYTDDKDGLLEAVKHGDTEKSATEIFEPMNGKLKRHAILVNRIKEQVRAYQERVKTFADEVKDKATSFVDKYALTKKELVKTHGISKTRENQQQKLSLQRRLALERVKKVRTKNKGREYGE